MFFVIHNVPCAPTSIGGGIEMGYTTSMPVRRSLTVEKFTLEISDRYIVILHLSDIHTKNLSPYFSLPSLPDTFSTCLTVTKINIFQ